jgi:hypothetical protein
MRRSRKPVRVFRSDEGSNPSLSVFQTVFSALPRDKDCCRTVAVGIARGSARASVGPALREFVPPTFPPDVAWIVSTGPSIGELPYPLQGRSATFVGERSLFTRASADRKIINAGHPNHQRFQGVAA